MEVEVMAEHPCDGEESMLTSAADAARVLVGLYSACCVRAAAVAVGPKRRAPAGACKPRRIAVAPAATCTHGGVEVASEVLQMAPLTPSMTAPPRRRVVYYRPESRIDISARTIMALLVSRGASRWMREGALRGTLGNTPDTSKGLRKLCTAGLVVRRGQGGRLDPYRYMVKAAFLSLSPEEQRAPLLEDDDDAAQACGIAADDVAVARVDLAPCGVEDLPEESEDSSCDAAPDAAAAAAAFFPHAQQGLLAAAVAA